MKLGFLASHRGSNMQVVFDACFSGALPATPAVVISNNREAEALERARRQIALDLLAHPNRLKATLRS